MTPGERFLDDHLPTLVERHRLRDRWPDVICPLSPGYLFVRARAIEWHEVLSTPGVLTVVKDGERPALIIVSFITRLRDAIERHRIIPEPITDSVDYQPGDEVIMRSLWRKER